jgi:hypothetical protein
MVSLFKGIVSRDWGSLQMVLLYRYRFLDITAWGLLFFKFVNILLGSMTFTRRVTGWRDILGCNCTCGTLISICTSSMLICTSGTLSPDSAVWQIF